MRAKLAALALKQLGVRCATKRKWNGIHTPPHPPTRGIEVGQPTAAHPLSPRCRPGDRVATLAFNTVRHLEAWWVLLPPELVPWCTLGARCMPCLPSAGLVHAGWCLQAVPACPVRHQRHPPMRRAMLPAPRSVCIHSACFCTRATAPARRYAISGIGAVCHTLNPRLFEEDLAYIINHAQARTALLACMSRTG